MAQVAKINNLKKLIIMKTLHTPGPWVFREQTTNNGSFFRIEGKKLNYKKPPVKIANVVTRDFDAAKANAKLIAAAPELLDALRLIEKMNVQTAIDKYGDASKADDWACVTTAREAIKKATE